MMAAFVLAVLCLAPLREAWFHRDDFWLIALARFVDHPFDFWMYDHSAFYFFRPFTMTLWWGAVSLFGADPFPQYLLNFALHMVVAIAFGSWMRAFSRSANVGVAAAVLFAVHPIAVRTTMWLSDRFDLLATAGTFTVCALFLSRSEAMWRRPVFCVVALCSFFSKETAFAMLAPLIVHFAFRRDHCDIPAGRMKRDLLWVVALACVAFCWRYHLLSGRGVPILDDAVSHTLIRGAAIHARAFSDAAFGVFNMHSALGVAASMFVLVAMIWLGGRIFIGRESNRVREGFYVGVALAVACVVLHAPIAVQNLDGDALSNYVPSVRLFHLALAVPFVLIVFPVCELLSRSRVAARLALIAAFAGLWGSIAQSQQFARDWTVTTNGTVKEVITSVSRQIDSQEIPDQCRIVVTGTHDDAIEFREASDVMIKAISRVPPSHLLRCVVVTERSPYFALVARDLCSREAWYPLQPIHPLVNPHPFGSICYQFFATPDASLLDQNTTVWIRYR